MTQQLNLYHAGLQRPRDWRTRHSAALLLAVLALTAAAGELLHWRARVLDAQANQLEAAALQRQTQLQALKQGRIAPPAGPPAAGAAQPPAERLAAEVQRLRALDAGQRRVRSLLDSGAAGRREGYSPYLLALARQARAEVWVTGLLIDPAGEQLELRGRLAQAGALPDYLRQLAGEPAFQGRRFAQMTLQRADGAADPSAAAAPYTEFTLRSQTAPAAQAAQTAAAGASR